MFSSTFALVLSVAAVLASKPLNRPLIEKLSGAYIFQFEDDVDHDDFDSMLSLEGKARMSFNGKLFKGASVQINDVENAEEKALKMAGSRGIKQMWPVELVNLPDDDVVWTGDLSHDTKSMLKRDGLYNGSYSTHVMTQIDKLHEEGYKGKGIKVAVIDTGVDYNHPTLGGCLGEGCVITRGYDLVGDNYNGVNQPVPDDDPMDCIGHGTHVIGILAAQENELGFLGAAPEAEVWAYKAFGCSGPSANDVLVAAVAQAFEDGADIISASVSVNSGFVGEALAVVAANAVAQGTPVIFGAGNQGGDGMWTASSGAVGNGVAAVGSLENTVIPTKQYVSDYTINGDRKVNFSYTLGFPEGWDAVELSLWAASGNFCDSTPEDLPDLSDFIVLLPRGDCNIEENAAPFAVAGAQYFIIRSDGEDVPAFYFDNLQGVAAVATVSRAIGSRWTDLLAEDTKMVLSMTGPEQADTVLVTSPNRETGGALSTFSSWGPSWDLDEVKPSFSAPGGFILSSFPLDQGGYQVRSGTSMATPLVAGVYALVAQVRGTTDPETLRSLFSASSVPLNFHDSKDFSDYLAPTPQQGGGLIQAYDAAFATTLLEPSQLSFGDTPNFRESLNFTISNEGDEEATYEITNIPTVTVFTYNDSSVYPAQFPNEVADEYVTLDFSEPKVTLPAGESVTIDVVPNTGSITPDRLPVWSGWVAVNSTDGTSLTLPYQGVSGSLYQQTVLASDAAWISRSDKANFESVPDDTKFSLPRPDSTPESPPALPVIAVLMALGSEKLRADIVPLDEDSDIPTTDFFGTETIGQPAHFPRPNVPRNGYPQPWNGTLDSGGLIPEGRYKIVMRALRIYGDPTKGNDWNVAEAGTLRIEHV